MDVESIEVDELLLVLKVAFLVLLYLFIWRIVRSASRDIRSPQESFVRAPEGGFDPPRASAPVPARSAGRLVVVKSPTLAPGDAHLLDSAPLTVGRSPTNHIELRDDGFASGSHARFDPRPDGVWVLDEGSTNGTFVNGARIARPHRLEPGDVVHVGDTDLRYEA
jgi:hypothetical protein